ncbi:MAG: hypothetical protein K5905_21400 [Roseibium sp.]|uniref:hypothetical protein n=1 Tax=Roseibium sp. TaxID=1936156 RepID=UPI0026360628|nr:hypothetical protein [Roseibium sp.]MCV0428021.1 hypothetical protein [Roseibium sp.]
MSMKITLLSALAVLTVGSVATVTLPATAQAKDRIVTCNDGTVFNFGSDDAISNEVACAGHGGVKPTSPFKASKIKSQGSVPKPGKAMRVSGTDNQRNSVPDGSYGGKNKAVAWTAGCYAEFGPNATHPDAALLEKCLGN